MPELPEVQSIISGLNRTILGKHLNRIDEHRKGTVFNEENYTEFGEIVDISRRGKYIIILTSDRIKIIIHLRMTGKLIYRSREIKTNKHTRATLVFQDGSALLFDDVRTFGRIEIYRAEDIVAAIETLGPEPLREDFGKKYLSMILKSRTAPIKNLLLNQRIIAGLGNIYASEILHRAGILPTRPGNNLSGNEIGSIVNNTKKVLLEAIEAGGTTISDYRQVENKAGSYQKMLKVYGKDFCSCGSRLNRIKLAGRSTFYCVKCQS